MKLPAVLLTCALFPFASWALDLEINSFECQDDLQVTLSSIEMDCEGKSRCSFGTSAALSGYLNFNGVENAGTDGEYIYLSGELTTWSIEYDLMSFHPIPICWENEDAADGNNEGRC